MSHFFHFWPSLALSYIIFAHPQISLVCQIHDCVEEKLHEITLNRKALAEWEVGSSQETLFPEFSDQKYFGRFSPRMPK